MLEKNYMLWIPTVFAILVIVALDTNLRSIRFQAATYFGTAYDDLIIKYKNVALLYKHNNNEFSVTPYGCELVCVSIIIIHKFLIQHEIRLA